MSIVQSGLLLVLSIPFLLAARMAFLHRQRAFACEARRFAPAEVSGANAAAPGLAAASDDLEAALRDAMVAVEAVARSHWVRMTLAAGAAMTVPVNPNALRIALRDTMLTAIHAAPGGQVLATAAMFGSQLYVRITDDGAGSDQQVREISMRPTELSIAQLGGSIEVEARPARGTSVTIRLPVPASAEQAVGDLVQRPVLADQAA